MWLSLILSIARALLRIIVSIPLTFFYRLLVCVRDFQNSEYRNDQSPADGHTTCFGHTIIDLLPSSFLFFSKGHEDEVLRRLAPVPMHRILTTVVLKLRESCIKRYLLVIYKVPGYDEIIYIEQDYSELSTFILGE
jgi:hypothetical protein